jgi:hypothetical protein
MNLVRIKVMAEDGPLYWSDVDGWVDLDSATLFNEEQVNMDEVILMARIGGFDYSLAEIEKL